MMMKHFEFLDHPADVIVRAYGSTLEEAFAAAGEALFALITDLSEIQSIDKTELEVTAPDRDGLLVAFLSELILRHEVDGYVFRDLKVTFTGRHSLTAVARGEKFDTVRHEPGMHVKAVSYHLLEIHEEAGSARVQVLFDV